MQITSLKTNYIVLLDVMMLLLYIFKKSNVCSIIFNLCLSNYFVFTMYYLLYLAEIGPLPPPSLVPNSLSDKSLRLQWKGVRRKNFKYKVQWKLEKNPGTWQYCQKELWTNDSIIQLDNLRPYTNYQVLLYLVYVHIYRMAYFK